MPTFSPVFGGSFMPPTSVRSANNRQYFRLARRTRKVRALYDASIGAAAGATATFTMSRVKASQTEQGGKRVIETTTPINRATTAGDITQLKNYLKKSSRIATPTKNWGLKFKA